jgi:hypothetical protein
MSHVNQQGEGSEKRGRRRVLTSLTCNWGWDESVPKHGKVTSLSVRGCFLLTTVYGERDAPLHVHLWVPPGEWIKLSGAVLYAIEGVGFGIGFNPPGEDDESRLISTMDHSEANPPVKR